MAERLEEITRRIEAVRQLEPVVGAMRAIAAARARQCRSRLEGIRAYAATVADAIGQASRLLPDNGPGHDDEARRGLILFGAEQGFAGAFSERVLDAAGNPPGVAIFVIGRRCARLARDRGLTLVWTGGMASHVDGVNRLAIHLADAFYDWIGEGGPPHVDVLFPIWTAGAGLAVERRSLLPLDPGHFVAAPHRVPPLTSLPAAELLARLAEEYVLAQLCEAAMRAFAAENEARVAAMARAKRDIAAMLDRLRARERQVRQEEITAEVIELAAGVGLSLADFEGPGRRC